ncbi:winged helix-turn-helix domain-containing protein [Streptomyces sp. Ag109_O5-10]|uniref:winged helix-turn-helix domain-containing protein n=1 Tax=Streptomyces sp. Ag109_O5-10 TaxID=1855349 RepID=UPI000896EBE2|nr:winged helix-turn-helix domain-containing protein [Streptomyces sp. Ag109_O5-10]SEE95266.1 regulatory protein, gntR family [Streptomyces sp. Ag109_O5-10]
MAARQAHDGGGRAFRQVSEALRTRMVDGTYPLGAELPAQGKLAKEFGVSRDTVQRVVRELGNEGWIESRQGSPARVVKIQRVQSTTAKATRSRQAMTLQPLISEAFEQPEVSLDVFTLTSESLDTHIRLQAERIRAGLIAPSSIVVRMLLPDPQLDLPYPVVRQDRDDPRLRERLRAITDRHTESLRTALRDLQAEKLVPSVDVQVRHVRLAPAFKLYVINRTEVLHALYEVIGRPIILATGEEIDALDVLGLGAMLTHHVEDADPDSPGSVFVLKMRSWFESVWNLLAE